MKKIQFVIAAFLVLSVSITLAGKPENVPAKETSPFTQMLITQIEALVQYPDFARQQNIQGFVLVSFTFDESGALVVDEANSNNEILKNYVVEKLAGLDLCSHAKKTGKYYNMRFNFTLL